ncbi:ABC transporter permease [Pelomonas sp. KK5]|uniref:ABC transporter permease n=1 Tax=Pelomonas sp. KK5 TaxID=1855730 RepID=UPI00097C3BDD|nr:ABC transporter permease [Pelomonas sp. KK5]
MKPVFLWTDIALWAMLAALIGYVLRIRASAQMRQTWERVLRDPAALSAGIVMALFLGVTMLDSLHFRAELSGGVYDTRTESVLDRLLARQVASRESSYSAPLAWRGYNISATPDGKRDFPRLAYGGAHLEDPQREWTGDLLARAGAGLALGALAAAGLFALFARRVGARDLLADRTHYPLRAAWLTLSVIALLAGPLLVLMPHYHVFGTDRTGNDVLYLALKSVRTAFVIGALSTLATLPLALVLGVLAGYFRGWVDEAIQYLYTTLSSVPNVLLIAACVLMVQVFLDKNPDAFETGAERSDLKMFLLCLILGLTGWAGLCRLVRAETMKLRELDYVQAASAFGVGHARIMARHIVPNVMHLVLITLVLSFSDLILYEAVLTYVGVGVDPAMVSFGGMINLARAEMSRDPLVWWSFAAAFGAMVSLVLAANLFADGVRDAFDPRSRSRRPFLRRRPR